MLLNEKSFLFHEIYFSNSFFLNLQHSKGAKVGQIESFISFLLFQSNRFFQWKSINFLHFFAAEKR